MSRSYFTEDVKLAHYPSQPWKMGDIFSMYEILEDKGYPVTCGLRMGCDRKWHDAWEVNREDIPRLIEMLFRQRIPVETQAEGHGKASIIFVYNTPASQLLECLPRFWRNNK